MRGYYLMPHPPLIIPEVGKGQEKKIQKTIDSCNSIGGEIGEAEIDTIIVITPHGTVFGDAVSLMDVERLSGDFGKFGAKKVSFDLKINTRLTNEIINEAEKADIPVVALKKQNAREYGITLELDHGAAVPLYFVKNLNNFEIVHITYGMLSTTELYSFGVAIDRACRNIGAKSVIIASGDLSHRLTKDGPYPYSPYGEKFDTRLIELLRQGDFKSLFNMDRTMISEAGECGLRSIYILAGTLDGKTAKADVLSYEGPFGVGYGVARFQVSEGESLFDQIKNSDKEKHVKRLEEGPAFTRLARRNIENYFKTGKSLTVKDIKDDELLSDKKGVFVSLKLAGELRGCIGTIEAVTGSIGEEILNNSLSAAFNDPRFSPLREEELHQVDISVDLLYPAEKCSLKELEPQSYGVIVSSGRKKGLLLPMLEGVDTIKEQVSIALQKAGITKNEPYEIERFKVERFKEVDV
ncbi:MAG: catalytic LigB subunit of aromatic ring-opening dioxygenase family protein [Eubacterium sp.]|jgi:AmmeMemoRadiSam system protein A/AmmeMemoRadiSam system protein B|nr:catalytic LigB subunit of aromatic ring-opening dioxygenase family protein [Eubacterium sp.]